MFKYKIKKQNETNDVYYEACFKNEFKIIYFFLILCNFIMLIEYALIGILIKKSLIPLFLGLIIFQILTLAVFVTMDVRRKLRLMDRRDMELEINEEGIETKWDGISVTSLWKDIRKIEVSERFMMIFYNSHGIEELVLPFCNFDKSKEEILIAIKEAGGSYCEIKSRRKKA